MSESKATYIDQHQKWPNLPLFFRPWYLDLTCEDKGWDVAVSRDKGGNIQGVLPYFKSKKYGISHITMPVLTPYLGPWLLYPNKMDKRVSRVSFEKKVLTELLSSIPDLALVKMHCHPELTNVLVANWLGYDCKTRYTYVIEKESEESLWAALDAKQRNIITSAQGKFKISSSNEIEAFYDLNKRSFDRSNEKIPYSLSFIKRLFIQLKEKEAGELLISSDQQGVMHSGVLLVKDKSSTYCLATGNNPKFKNSGALPYLMWKGIVSSMAHTTQFNFEGGMIPNIEQFFRSYGGELVPYYRLEKSKNTFFKGLFTWMGKV